MNFAKPPPGNFLRQIWRRTPGRPPGVWIALVLCAAVRGEPPRASLHSGTCDGSTGLALGSGLFVSANDEDNRLRVYKGGVDGTPLQTLPLDGFLDVEAKSPEADLEGSARIGDVTFWISSHGRNKNGKFRPNRHRLFALRLEVSEGMVTCKPVGKPWRGLVDALIQAPGLQQLGLAEGSTRIPEEPGGLNIEGLAATAGGHLLIGFRNPVPAGRAIVVPLLNPLAVMEGEPAEFGPPRLLDLGGRGIRSLMSVGGDLLILAGPPGPHGDTVLFRQTPEGSLAPWQPGVSLAGLNPEGLMVFRKPGESGIFLLSDDGGNTLDGTSCKELPDPGRRQFRTFPAGVWPGNIPDFE